jgi:hypothetical protein
MSKRFLSTFSAALVAAAAVAIPASATAPQAVTFATTGHFTSSTTAAGTWTATGAVNDSGTYTEVFRLDAGTIHATKTLVDPAGNTIVLDAEGLVVFFTPTTGTFADGNWHASGTGAFAHLRAEGEPVATGLFDLAAGTTVVMHSGQAHFD